MKGDSRALSEEQREGHCPRRETRPSVELAEAKGSLWCCLSGRPFENIGEPREPARWSGTAQRTPV